MPYTIEQFRALCHPEFVILTQHGRKRLAERGIRIRDVCRAIESGEIIEDYPDDFPFPSCSSLATMDASFSISARAFMKI
ncbi:MAG: DUF4258 domain-containing protein [Fretibacterium sp.]|nr:DUF4258 domain-containing protein [Fretibacterium sp.]